MTACLRACASADVHLGWLCLFFAPSLRHRCALVPVEKVAHPCTGPGSLCSSSVVGLPLLPSLTLACTCCSSKQGPAQRSEFACWWPLAGLLSMLRLLRLLGLKWQEPQRNLREMDMKIGSYMMSKRHSPASAITPRPRSAAASSFVMRLLMWRPE